MSLATAKASQNWKICRPDGGDYRKSLKPDGHPRVEAQKDELIQYYVDCSKAKLWAWAGLLRLLEETKGKNLSRCGGGHVRLFGRN